LPYDRRRFLDLSLRAAGAAVVVPKTSRPEITHGVASGDIAEGRATIWSRCNRPARMIVEYATTDSFKDAHRVTGSHALAGGGLTAHAELTGLPPGQRIVYRVSFESLADPGRRSAPVAGSFRSAGAGDVTLGWSADVVGQGWGINREWGGLRGFETVRRAGLDLFVHCGDTIYADQPLKPEVTLDDGTIWRNVVAPAKSKVAETLEEFRGCHLYNLMDDNVRRFNAEVPSVTLWDDHEVRDNWYPGRSLEQDDRYTVKDIDLLAFRARQAFLEHYPISPVPLRSGPRIFRSLRYGPTLEVFALDLRSDRGANSPNRQAQMGRETALMGGGQLDWLKATLTRSTATWKVVASDLPIGLVVPDGPVNFEAFANADGGPPLGRELEVADLLRHLRDNAVRNVVWITADVHYAAAHHYDPERAAFRDFLPFWEFVAGPLHAGTFGPNKLDATFGPEVRFLAIPPGMKPNRPPSAGLQFFGTLRIDGRSRVMTARLHDLSGATLFTVDLPPDPGR
jgi:alkaline phosphatase D